MKKDPNNNMHMVEYRVVVSELMTRKITVAIIINTVSVKGGCAAVSQ